MILSLLSDAGISPKNGIVTTCSTSFLFLTLVSRKSCINITRKGINKPAKRAKS
jgi:hypothetical protein